MSRPCVVLTINILNIFDKNVQNIKYTLVFANKFAYINKKLYLCNRICKDMNEKRLMDIFDSIREGGFSAHTLQLIDNYTNDILYGRTNLDRFNQQEHAGLCSGGAPLIGAYIVCCYARASFEPSRFSLTC